MRNTVYILIATALVALLAACSTLASPITLTGDVDSDFTLGGTPMPGVVIRDGTSLVPPYGAGAQPLAAVRADASQMILSGATIPSGFHVARVAAFYDCASDTIYIGLDVSSPTTDPAGLPTGAISRAWDADGDGNACTVCNDMLVNPTPICPGLPGQLDNQLQGLGNDDVPSPDLSPLAEDYQVFLDLDRDGITDAVLLAYDDGRPADTSPTEHDIAGPCGTSAVHMQLRAGGTQLVINPANNPVVEVNAVFVADTSSPDYPTHRDIEFSIKGLRKIPLSTAPGAAISPYCDLNIKTFADSDYDASAESGITWGRYNFVSTGRVDVTAKKLVDTPQVCSLPATATYTLQAKNTGTIDADITISDSALAGGPWTFSRVTPGQTVTVNPAPTKTFDATFCGSAPFVNTMSVSAVPSDCCTTGSATASAAATVTLPPSADVQVSCSKSVDTATVSSFPTTVTYTLSARNTSTTDTPVTIRITDVALGVDQTFTGVAKGAAVTVTPAPTKTFDSSFAGANPFVNTMTAQAAADGTCVCGNTTASCSSSATVTFANQGPTRTPGFWMTHWSLLQQQISACGPWSFGCAQAVTVSDALALMLDNQARLRTGVKRTALGQARKQLAFQLTAAYANVCAFSTQPPVDLAAAASALGGTNITTIRFYAGVLGTWNGSGDLVAFPAGFSPGSADPQTGVTLSLLSNITQGNCFK